MSNKEIRTRIQNKHDFEHNWILSDLVPMVAEMIVYDAEVDPQGTPYRGVTLTEGKLLINGNTRDPYKFPRFKFGDGISTVNELPFASSGVEELPEDDGSEYKFTAYDITLSEASYYDVSLCDEQLAHLENLRIFNDEYEGSLSSTYGLVIKFLKTDSDTARIEIGHSKTKTYEEPLNIIICEEDTPVVKVSDPYGDFCNAVVTKPFPSSIDFDVSKTKHAPKTNKICISKPHSSYARSSIRSIPDMIQQKTSYEGPIWITYTDKDDDYYTYTISTYPDCYKYSSDNTELSLEIFSQTGSSPTQILFSLNNGALTLTSRSVTISGKSGVSAVFKLYNYQQSAERYVTVVREDTRDETVVSRKLVDFSSADSFSVYDGYDNYNNNYLYIRLEKRGTSNNDIELILMGMLYGTNLYKHKIIIYKKSSADGEPDKFDVESQITLAPSADYTLVSVDRNIAVANYDTTSSVKTDGKITSNSCIVSLYDSDTYYDNEGGCINVIENALRNCGTLFALQDGPRLHVVIENYDTIYVEYEKTALYNEYLDQYFIYINNYNNYVYKIKAKFIYNEEQDYCWNCVLEDPVVEYAPDEGGDEGEGEGEGESGGGVVIDPKQWHEFWLPSVTVAETPSGVQLAICDPMSKTWSGDYNLKIPSGSDEATVTIPHPNNSCFSMRFTGKRVAAGDNMFNYVIIPKIWYDYLSEVTYKIDEKTYSTVLTDDYYEG